PVIWIPMLALMVPALLILPVNSPTFCTRMPTPVGPLTVIVPELVMPPPNADNGSPNTATDRTAMPANTALMVPALVMPPKKVEVQAQMRIPVPDLDTIRRVPVLTMPPVNRLTLATEMPAPSA